MLNEPRGGVFRHVNLLVPPKNAKAQMGFIIMEPADTPPMSGSNTICVATVLLDTGILPMTEPRTRMVLEAPGGLVEVVADCRDGKADDLAETGVRITAAATEQLGFVHPGNPEWDHISFCQFAAPIARRGDTLISTNAVAIRPG